jgi:hypothetical protein
MSTPPQPGDRPSVRVGQDLSDDLTVIMSASNAKTTVSDIVREAVRHMADAYRRAQDYGDVPEGTAPTILGAYYAEAPDQTPVRRLSDASYTAPVRPADTQLTKAASAATTASDDGPPDASDVRHDGPARPTPPATPIGHPA